MSKPTQDDANIMLQLLRWGAAESSGSNELDMERLIH